MEYPPLQASGLRLRKSCDRCVGLKKRCGGETPSCTRCLGRQRPCHYSEEKPRGRPKTAPLVRAGPRSRSAGARGDHTASAHKFARGKASAGRTGSGGSGGSRGSGGDGSSGSDHHSPEGRWWKLGAGASSASGAAGCSGGDGSTAFDFAPQGSSSPTNPTDGGIAGYDFAVGSGRQSPLKRPRNDGSGGGGGSCGGDGAAHDSYHTGLVTSPGEPPQQSPRRRRTPVPPTQALPSAPAAAAALSAGDRERQYLVSYMRAFGGLLPLDAPAMAAEAYLSCPGGRLPACPSENNARTARVAAVEGLAYAAAALGCLVQGPAASGSSSGSGGSGSGMDAGAEFMLIANVNLQHALARDGKEAANKEGGGGGGASSGSASGGGRSPGGTRYGDDLTMSQRNACSIPLPTDALLSVLQMAEAFYYRLTHASDFFDDCMRDIVAAAHASAAAKDHHSNGKSWAPAAGSSADAPPPPPPDIWPFLLPGAQQLFALVSCYDSAPPLPRLVPLDEDVEAAALAAAAAADLPLLPLAGGGGGGGGGGDAWGSSAFKMLHSAEYPPALSTRPSLAAPALAAGGRAGSPFRGRFGGGSGGSDNSSSYCGTTARETVGTAVEEAGELFLRRANFVLCNVGRSMPEGRAEQVGVQAELCRRSALKQAQQARSLGLLLSLVGIWAFLTYAATQPLTLELRNAVAACTPVLSQIFRFCPGILAWVPGGELVTAVVAGARIPVLSRNLFDAWEICRYNSAGRLPALIPPAIAAAGGGSDSDTAKSPYIRWLEQELRRWAVLLAPTLVPPPPPPPQQQQQQRPTALTLLSLSNTLSNIPPTLAVRGDGGALSSTPSGAAPAAATPWGVPISELLADAGAAAACGALAGPGTAPRVSSPQLQPPRPVTALPPAAEDYVLSEGGVLPGRREQQPRQQQQPHPTAGEGELAVAFSVLDVAMAPAVSGSSTVKSSGDGDRDGGGGGGSCGGGGGGGSCGPSASSIGIPAAAAALGEPPMAMDDDDPPSGDMEREFCQAWGGPLCQFL